MRRAEPGAFAAAAAVGDESFRALVELSPDAVFVIADGYHVFANACGIALLGGRVLADLQTKPALDFMHSSMTTTAEERLGSINSGDALPYVEEKVVRLDGTVVDIESAGSPIRYQGRPAALVVVRDITARKQAEAALEAAQQRFTAAFAHAPTGMAILRADGSIVEVNPAFGRLLGAEPADLLGQCVWDLLSRDRLDPDESPDAGPARADGDLLRHAGRPAGSGTFCYRRPDGRAGWMHVSAAPLHEAGLSVMHALDVTAQKAAEADLARQATHDPLTGLANRALFHERISAALPRAQGRGRTVAVMFIDLDDFKVVNDSAGHDAGDRFLRAVADRLVGCAGAGSTVARLGGDEFGVLLDDVVEPAEVQRWAQRVTAALRVPVDAGVVLPAGASASIGIAVAAPGQQDVADLLRCADVAMYAAKRRGGDRHAVYTPDLRPGHGAPEVPASARGPRRDARRAGQPAGAAFPAPLGSPEAFASRRVVERTLAAARAHLDMDLAFVTEVTSDTMRFDHVCGDARSFGLSVDLSVPADAGYCRRMLDGRIPGLIPDTAAEPGVADLPITAVTGIGAYVGVPLTLPDGQVYGALCCVARRPRPQLDDADASFLRMLAQLISEDVARVHTQRAGAPVEALLPPPRRA